MSEPVKVPIFRIELRMRINGTAKAYAMNAKKSTLSVCVLPNPGRIVSLTMRDCQISMPLQSVPINSEKLFLNIDRVGVPTINDRVGLG